MRVGITGPSELTYNEEQFVADTAYDFLLDTEPPILEFWSGVAHGVDSIGIRAAIRARVPAIGLTIPRGAWHNEGLVRELLADKEKQYELLVKQTKEYPHKPDAYHARNNLTIASIDALLAFPPNTREPDQKRGGRGAGTWSTIRKARKKGLPIYFYPLDGSQPFVEGQVQGILL
jgi:hypothetical protein